MYSQSDPSTHLSRPLAGLMLVVICGLALAWAFVGGALVAGQWSPVAVALSLGPAFYVVIKLFQSMPAAPFRWVAAALGIGLATLAFRQPWSERHQFASAISSLQVGTPEASVRSQLARFIAGDSETVPAAHSNALNGATQRLLFRCSQSKGCGNADLGLVYLREGRVVRTEFCAD